MTDHISELPDGTLLRKPPADFTPAEIAARNRPTFVACRMEGCRCGLLHAAYSTCNVCRGTGHFMGGDEYQVCFVCRDRFRAATLP